MLCVQVKPHGSDREWGSQRVHSTSLRERRRLHAVESRNAVEKRPLCDALARQSRRENMEWIRSHHTPVKAGFYASITRLFILLGDGIGYTQGYISVPIFSLLLSHLFFSIPFRCNHFKAWIEPCTWFCMVIMLNESKLSMKDRSGENKHWLSISFSRNILSGNCGMNINVALMEWSMLWREKPSTIDFWVAWSQGRSTVD